MYPMYMYMDQDICQEWKRTRNPDKNYMNLQPRYRNGIYKRKMYHAHNKKLVKRNKGRSSITKSRKHQNISKTNNYKYFGKLEVDSMKETDERKRKKIIPQKNKILCTKNRGETQTEGAKDKESDDNAQGLKYKLENKLNKDWPAMSITYIYQYKDLKIHKKAKKD